VAGALGSLGCALPGPDDRLPWSPSNPDHYESHSLTLFDEDLLVGLGGSWEGPPALGPHWPQSAANLGAGRAQSALRRAFPDPGAVVWKDPRLCLLLPYWRQELGGPQAALFVWRTPEAVARSLSRRDGMPIPDGLALWERYNRRALAGLRGMPVSVVEYDAVVTDPAGFVEDSMAWLGSLDGFAGTRSEADPEAATKLVRSDLRHHGDAPAPDRTFDGSGLASLTDLLRGLDGHHRSLAVDQPGEESSWTTALLEHRRRQARQRAALDAVARQREAARHRHFVDRARQAEVIAELADREADLAYCEAQVAQLEAQLAGAQEALTNLHDSTSWRITRPLRWSTAQLEQRARPHGPDPSDPPARTGER
jgi:hypothetical protein